MANSKILNIQSDIKVNSPNVESKNIPKSFTSEDTVEIHIFDLQDNKLLSLNDYTNYTNNNTSLSFEMEEILQSVGYIYGKFKIQVLLQRTKIFKTDSKPFTITEVSPSRKEIRLISPKIKNGLFRTSIKTFISEIENSSYFKDFSLNFGQGVNITGINVLLNTNTSKYELLVKTLDPLPTSINKNNTCKIVENIIDPVSFEMDMGNPPPIDDTISLRGPNFNIAVREQKSIPSDYKNYDQILKYTESSSYNNLLNILEKEEVPEIQYDYIRPVSESLEAVEVPYHFENFVHFSNATERLKNFKYKLELIESKNATIGDINNAALSNTLAQAATNNKTSIIK